MSKPVDPGQHPGPVFNPRSKQYRVDHPSLSKSTERGPLPSRVHGNTIGRKGLAARYNSRRSVAPKLCVVGHDPSQSGQVCRCFAKWLILYDAFASRAFSVLSINARHVHALHRPIYRGSSGAMSKALPYSGWRYLMEHSRPL